MRKSLLSIGLFAVIIAFAACCGKGGNKQNEGAECCAKSEQCCKAKAEFAEKWAKFDELAVEEQKALIAKRVECYEKCLAKCAEKKAECAANKEEHPCKEKAEMTEEQKAECIIKKEERAAKKAELAEIWANFENLDLAAKKAFFDDVDAMKCSKEKKCCKKDGEKCCKKDGEKCSKKEGKECSKKCEKH